MMMKEVHLIIHNKCILDMIISGAQDVDRIMEEVRGVYSMLNEDELKLFRLHVSKTVLPHFKRRWETAGSRERFVTKHSDWLKEYTLVIIDSPTEADATAGAAAGPSYEPQPEVVIRSRGRPRKGFGECSATSKRRKAEELRSLYSDEQTRAAFELPPEFAALSLSPTAALVLLLDAKCSKLSYQQHRLMALSVNNKLYPNYHQVLDAKKPCRNHRE